MNENQNENDNINVVENQEVNQINDEPETPLEMAKKIIPLAKKGIEITSEECNLNTLFSNILNCCNDELIPAIEKLSDFETMTDDLKNAGDVLVKVINYSDEGFTLTDVEDNEQPFSEVHLLFSEILMISDTEIRQFIPTPVNA